jgi:hypothetical protein
MAKQNVTFIERHVEKVVIGVTGAVLLATAVLYLVGTPHKVDVQGESLGPQQLAKIRPAEATREKRNGPSPDGQGAPLPWSSPTSRSRPRREPAQEIEVPTRADARRPRAQGAQHGKIRLARSSRRHPSR